MTRHIDVRQDIDVRQGLNGCYAMDVTENMNFTALLFIITVFRLQ